MKPKINENSYLDLKKERKILSFQILYLQSVIKNLGSPGCDTGLKSLGDCALEGVYIGAI